MNRVLLATLLVAAALATGTAGYAVHMRIRRTRRRRSGLPALPPVRVPASLVEKERVTTPPSSAEMEKAWHDFVIAHGDP